MDLDDFDLILSIFNEIHQELLLSQEITSLLDKILTLVAHTSCSDGVSLYLIEEDRLQFKRAINLSLDNFQERLLEFQKSMSCSSEKKNRISEQAFLQKEVVIVEDAYQSDCFDDTFDKHFSYQTKSVLCVPMMDRYADVVGVLQFINYKSDNSMLLTLDNIESVVQPYPKVLLKWISFLAQQVGIALQKYLMHEESKFFLDRFISASAYMVELRDNSTFGHGSRVASYTLNTMHALPKSNYSAYAHIYLTEDNIREIRYAALLHDVGKVAVSENILLKSHKITPSHFESILMRFDIAKEQVKNFYFSKMFHIPFRSSR